MKPYYEDDAVTLWHGDSLEVLRELPDQSVDCCVTSPPYFGLRDYGEEGQYGLEASPAEYVETMRAVFAEVRRVLADDGTLWLNLGDSYSSRSGGAPQSGNIETNGGERFRRPRAQDFVPAKNLMGMPWRTAFALQDDGWILRNEIIWHKAGGLPTSADDRLANKHEHVFMFSKSPRYYFDLDAIKTPAVAERPAGNRPDISSAYGLGAGGKSDGRHFGGNPTSTLTAVRDLVNPGDVWRINPQPFSEAHFACMPWRLAERCVLPSRPGGVVLDPFSGSGTTGLAAARHGRRYVGIDLNAEYLDLSLRTRLGQTSLLDEGIA